MCGFGVNKSGSTATGTSRILSIDTFMSSWMSLIEFSLTTTTRGMLLATLPCMLTNEYQRPMARRFQKFGAWSISSLRSLVIGWCSVTIVGNIFSIFWIP